MTKAELIRENAEKLRGLHGDIHSLVRFRNESEAQREQWEQACRKFHESYDQFAFPGGLARFLNNLDANEPTAVDDAVTFLEVDPLFFRSGYIKERILERLRRAPLDEAQKSRLQRVILARVRDPKTRREFRRYCRLAPFIADPEFEEEIRKLAGPSGSKPKRAQWVLEHLRQGVPKNQE